jgi:hypothetical protein
MLREIMNGHKNLSLLCEKDVLFKKMLFKTCSTGRSPVFSESSSPLKCNLISEEIPAPRAQKRPNIPVGSVFAHWKGQSLKPHNVAEGRPEVMVAVK